MDTPSTPLATDPPRATRWWDEPVKNMPGKMKLGLVVAAGFVLMSMFMNLQGPAPSVPTASLEATATPRTPPATDERTARLETERLQKEFEAASAQVDLARSRAQLAPPQASPLTTTEDSYQTTGAGRALHASERGLDDEAAPKPGFVTRRRTVAAGRATQADAGTTASEPSVAVPAVLSAPAPLQATQDTIVPVAQKAPTNARHTTLREGTVIDAVLANRLNGSAIGPVVCRVTNPIYGYDGTAVLIPQGATVIGASQAVTEFGQNRLAVSFHRLQMPPPDGRSYDLNQFTGLSQIGDVGLRDQVNAHYLSMFGASAMVGLINGLTQTLGNVGGGRNNSTIVLGDVGSQAGQTSGLLMQKFLNRPPEVTIRAGDRVKVYVTSDLELPVWGGER